VWRRRKTTSDRKKYKAQKKRVNYLTREANLPTKTLWRNLDSVGAKTSTENELIFSPDQLNLFLTSTQNVQHKTGQQWKTMQVRTNLLLVTPLIWIFNALHQIKSNASGLDGVSLNFLKLILPQVLGIVTHVFNTILTNSIYLQPGS
jgi:hypothetical protein